MEGWVPGGARAGGPSEASAEDHKIPGTEEAILADSRLGNEQKAALIAVYRSMLSPQNSVPQNSVPQNGATQDIAAQDSAS
jgi:hypothetical protein